MSRFSLLFRASLPVSFLLLTATPSVYAANLSGPVDKAEWATNVPSYIDMYIGLPDNMPEKPPIVVNIHSCSNSAGGQWSYDGFAPLRDAMESVGFIMILPQQSRNCWNVGAPESLTHGGGGDTGAIVQMVQYALETYNGDPTRVYVMGGSGGGMTTQALLAVYPEVFKAGHARAGVPAGCWEVGYQDGDQWSDSCAGGSVDWTAQEWGDYVRAINPEFTGPRPRLQLNHGNQDEVISYNNFREAIEQWTNVLGLDPTPTSTDSNFQGASSGYDRQFWEDDCGYTVLEGWTALGKTHSMGYEAVHILEWFGLDQVREQDPWDEACGDSTGTAATTTGGTTTGGTTTGGTTTGGTTTGGATTTGGSTGMGGSTGTGSGTSSTTAPGTASTGASVTSGGVTGTTATTASATTGPGTTGAAATTGGTLTATSTGGSAGDPSAQASNDSGCSCTAAGGRELPLSWMLTLAGLGLASGLRRRR